MSRARSYRFLLTPKWVVFTVVMVAVVAGCLAAASWQWSRLHERRDRNAEIVAKQSVAPVPLAEVAPLDAPLDVGRDAQWTLVSVTGVYDPGSEVLVRNRAYDGIPGVHVVTPLRLPDAGGAAVLVNRGFLPRPPDPADPVIPPQPLTGPVTVTGRVRATQEPGRFGQEDPDTGVLRDVARVDIERLRQQTPYALAPVYLELVSQEPVDPNGPTPVRPPELGDGPHLSYTGQWLFFAVLAVVGWVLVVRKTASGHRQQAARDAAVQTAITTRSAAAIPLRNVKPVKRVAAPAAEPAAGEAGPPAPPMTPPPPPGDGERGPERGPEIGSGTGEAAADEEGPAAPPDPGEPTPAAEAGPPPAASGRAEEPAQGSGVAAGEAGAHVPRGGPEHRPHD